MLPSLKQSCFLSLFWTNKDLIQEPCYPVIEESSVRTKGLEVKMILRQQRDAAKEQKELVLNKAKKWLCWELYSDTLLN